LFSAENYKQPFLIASMINMPRIKRSKQLIALILILCLSSMVSFSTVTSQITFSNVSTNADVYTLTDNIYNLTFVESGLPSGTQWEAIFNGTQHFSTTNTIKIGNVSAATYLWSIPNAVALNLYEGNGTVYLASPPFWRNEYCTLFSQYRAANYILSSFNIISKPFTNPYRPRVSIAIRDSNSIHSGISIHCSAGYGKKTDDSQKLRCKKCK